MTHTSGKPTPQRTSEETPEAHTPDSFEIMALAKRLNHDAQSLEHGLREMRETIESIRFVLFEKVRSLDEMERMERRRIVCGALIRDGKRCRKRVETAGTRCPRHTNKAGC